jgi:hypothetical protein
MAKTIDQLLKDADDIIEKRASVKTASAADDDDSIEKMAAALMAPLPVVTEVVAPQDSAIQTVTEKVAEALVLGEFLMNLEQIQKLEMFKQAAQAQGHSAEQIDAHLEKIAARLDYKRIMPLIPVIGAAGLAGAGGAYLGHKSGKKSGSKEGYSQALSDVDKAMKDYQL